VHLHRPGAEPVPEQDQGPGDQERGDAGDDENEGKFHRPFDHVEPKRGYL
jgi:hypothetical protein